MSDKNKTTDQAQHTNGAGQAAGTAVLERPNTPEPVAQPATVATTQAEQAALGQRAQLSGHPIAIADRIAREIDDLFDNFGLGRAGFANSPLHRQFGFTALVPRGFRESAASHWVPQTELFARNGQLVVRVDLPGVNKDDIQIDVEDESLVIRGERKSEHAENRAGVYHSERSYGSFYREIPLPEDVNPDDIRAAFEHGVLEVTLTAPPKPEKRKQRIEIV